jgi:hypothetical protein
MSNRASFFNPMVNSRVVGNKVAQFVSKAVLGLSMGYLPSKLLTPLINLNQRRTQARPKPGFFDLA